MRHGRRPRGRADLPLHPGGGGCRKPVRRLWISSLTPEAIRRGFASLRPLSDFDPLADSAHARARADWLVGMNLSRAATLAHGELFSVGRVQTPTLALLVEREKAIRSFVPEDYLEVEATFAPDHAAADGDLYRGTWFHGRAADSRGAAAAEGRGRGEGHRRARAGRAGGGGVGRVGDAPPSAAAPLRPHRAAAPREPALRPFREGDACRSRRRSTRSRKLLTYPRTDSRHLSRDVAADAARGGGRDRGALLCPPRPRDRRAAARPALRGRREGERPPRHRPDRCPGRRPRPEPRRAPRLRSRLPSPAHGLARRARLRGHLRRHAGRERPARPGRGPLRELGHSGAAGRLEGPRAASLTPGPARARRRRAGRRGRSGPGPPAGPRRRPADARRWSRGRPEEDAAAPSLHRRDAPDGHGEGRGRRSTTASCRRP